jgi:hypothetical protein
MADNTRRLGGVSWLFIDGVSYPVVGDVTYSVATVTRSTLMGMDRVHGYSEVPRAGFISATIRDEAGTSLLDIQEMTNVSVSLQAANGKRVQGVGMWVVEAAEVATAEATFTVRWEGEDVRDDG